MRTIPDKMRTGEVYPVAFGFFIFINIGLHTIKRGTRSCAAVSWMWRSASDVCRYLAARSHARCGCAGGTRASARTISRPEHVGMRAAGVWVRSCDQRCAGDSSAARIGVEGAGTTAEGYGYFFARVCCICVRYRIRCARTRSILSHLVLLYS